MNNGKWRELVSRGDLLKLESDLESFLDNLEKKLAVPGTCPTRDCKDLLAEWVIIGLRIGYVTSDSYNEIRDALHLHQELPEIHMG